MLRSCPQHNEVSARQKGWGAFREVDGKTIEESVGNGPAICGAAVITAALVLSSKNPEQARKNAEAIRKVAQEQTPPISLSEAENEALGRFASGRMSPEDVQNVQQVLNRMVRNSREPNPTSGTSREQMASMLALLAKEGPLQARRSRCTSTTATGRAPAITLTSTPSGGKIPRRGSTRPA